MRRFGPWATLALFIPMNLGGCGGAGAGFLGLQDFQRDILFGLGGGLAGALLDRILPAAPVDDSARGAPGPAGAQGPPGPTLFSVYVDSFYGGVVDDVLGVVPVSASEPKLASGGGPVALSVGIPSNYDGQTPVLMRVVLFRSGPCTSSCFGFSLHARRAGLGATAAECFGGSGDCADGARFVLLDNACANAASGDIREFIIADLPLGNAGLDLPAVQGGDMLGFELNPIRGDGGEYHLLGVEFSDAAGEALRNAEVFKSEQELDQRCASR